MPEMNINGENHLGNWKDLCKVYQRSNDDIRGAIRDMLCGANIKETAPIILACEEEWPFIEEFIQAHQQDDTPGTTELLLEMLKLPDCGKSLL